MHRVEILFHTVRSKVWYSSTRSWHEILGTSMWLPCAAKTSWVIEVHQTVYARAVQPIPITAHRQTSTGGAFST